MTLSVGAWMLPLEIANSSVPKVTVPEMVLLLVVILILPVPVCVPVPPAMLPDKVIKLPPSLKVPLVKV